jgi:hypothetical protein
MFVEVEFCAKHLLIEFLEVIFVGSSGACVSAIGMLFLFSFLAMLRDASAERELQWDLTNRKELYVQLTNTANRTKGRNNRVIRKPTSQRSQCITDLRSNTM